LPRGLCLFALAVGTLLLSGCVSDEPPRPATAALPAATVARPPLAAPSVSPVASPSPSPSPVADGRTYVVGVGDTLSSIAERFYGDSSLWRPIFEANRDTMNGPDALQVGMTIRIPPRPS
jgi:nucleoid-associated protein YgaU